MKLTARLSTLALVGALVLTGCGDGDKDSDKDAKSGDKATSSASNDPTDSGDGGSDEPKTGEKVDVADFLADLREGTEGLTSAHMTMTMNAMGQKMTGEGDINYEGDTPSMAMTMSMGAQGSMEMRMVDGFLYMKMPGQGDKWIKMDMKKAMAELGMGDLMEQFDPATGFEMYADAFTGATLIGEEDVDGEETKHYRVTLDTSKVESFKKLPAGADLPKTMDYDIWLDDDNRMRKTIIEIPASGKVEMLISDYGKDVDVEAPPASQITEMPGM